MGYKKFVSMSIAVIGIGKTAETYAVRYAMAGHDVFIAPKGGENAGLDKRLAIYDNIVVCSIEDAAAVADLIIISSSPKDVREIAYWLGDVRGKVIIDATANVHTGADEQVNTLGAIKAITGSQHVVKVFSTRGYERLLKPLFQKEKIQLVLAGDSKKAKEITKILTKDLGINDFVDLGPDEAIPLFDELTKCWRNLALKNGAEKVNWLIG